MNTKTAAATGPVHPAGTRRPRSSYRRQGAGSSLKALLAAGVGLLLGSTAPASAAIVTAVQVPLTPWAAETYPALPGFGAANWGVLPDTFSVRQHFNGQAAVYYSDALAQGTELQGRVNVYKSTDPAAPFACEPGFPIPAPSFCGWDNDKIGWVVGWNPGDTGNTAADYLLIDWMRPPDANNPPSFNFGDDATLYPPPYTGIAMPGTTPATGLAVSRVRGVPGPDEQWGHMDFPHNGLVNAGGSGVVELERGATLGNVGWNYNQTYDFRLQFSQNVLRLYVNGNPAPEIELTAAEAGLTSFPNGRWGFYDFSQDSVRFQAIAKLPFEDVFTVPEGSKITLIEAGSGLTVYADLDNNLATGPDGYEVTGPAIVFDATSMDGPSTHTVRVKLCNPANDCAQGTYTVHVINVAPVPAAGSATRVFPGATYLLRRPYTDAGLPDTHDTADPEDKITVDWGDGSPLQTIPALDPFNGPLPLHSGGRVEVPHVYTTVGTYTLNLCVTDDDGATGCAANPVLVTTEFGAEAGGPYQVFEGSTIQLEATASFDPNLGVLTFDWDLDNDGSFETTGQTPTFSAVGKDGPSTQPIKVRACKPTNLGGDCVIGDGSVQILNVAPVLEAGPDVTIPLGTTYNLNGSFTDVGTPDTHTASVSWGDGSSAEAATVTPDGQTAPNYFPGGVSGAKLYNRSGTFFVTVTVRDDDGGVDVDSLTVRVVDPTVNQVPSANPPSGTVPEGSSVQLSGSGSDPDGDSLTYSWDLDNNGSFETSGQNPTFSAAGRDGPSSQTVVLRVCDPNNNCATAQGTVTITNVPPAVTATGSAIDEGQTASVSGTLSDPGVPDTFTLVINWGDGGANTTLPLPAGTTTYASTRVYGDNGSYPVTVTATDDDGGVGTASTAVVVRNVAPDLTLDRSGVITFASGPAFTGRKGIAQTHRASATDPGSDDETFTWSFGATGTTFNNGSSPDPLPSSSGIFPFAATHSANVTFTTPGVHTIEVTVVDDDRGTDSDRLAKLVVDNCASTKTIGFWKQQFDGKGQQHIDRATLNLYLDIVRFASATFGPSPDPVSLSDSAEAFRILDGAKAKEMRPQAVAQALGAWLNFAKGGVGWDEMVDTNRDGIPDLRYSDLIRQVDAILTNPNASRAELERAKNLAEAVNLSAPSEQVCGGR